MLKHICLVFLSLGFFVAISACQGEKAATEDKPAADKPAADETSPPKTTPKKATTSKSSTVPQAMPADEKAPEKFAVKLETAKGDIVIDVHRDWAPHGVDRFYSLVKQGYFQDVAFFRVIKGFMAQVGLSGDPALNAKWRKNRIPDDPVKESNARGTISFATSGKNSRTTQFFVNFGDNTKLDRMGFAPFGKVRDMAPVDALYADYGEGAPRGQGPSQRRIQLEGNAYLKKEFPKLDYIKQAVILE